MNTPWDTVEHVNWDNLETQLQLTYALLQNVLNIDNAVLTQWWNEPPFAELKVAPWRYFTSFVNATALVEWDSENAWYKPVPKALGIFVKYWSGGRFADPAFTNLMLRSPYVFAFTDDNGRVQVPPVGHVTQFSSYSVFFTAWVIDDETGNVLYAPDQGAHAWPRTVSISVNTTTGINIVDGGFVTVFNASTAVIYNMVDSNALSGGAWMAGTSQQWLMEPHYFMPVGVAVDIRVLAFETHSTAESYSIHWTGGPDLTTAVIAFPPEKPVEFKVMVPGREIRYPEAVLNNASSQDPYGTGYKANPGRQIQFTVSFLDMAKNLYFVNDEQVKVLTRVNPQEEASANLQGHNEVPVLIAEAEGALAKAQYGQYFQYSIEAWRNAEAAYRYTRSTLEDAASTVPYFALILLPFVIMAERAIFNLPGIKKVLSYLLIGGLAIGALYFLHPGFSVAASPASIMIGTSLILLSIPLFLIMLGRTLEFVEALRIRIYGKHAEEVSRASLLLTGLFLGVDHMRKRKMRAALTLATIVIMVMAFVNMVSISAVTITRVRQYTEDVTVDYNGVYLHQLVWGSGEPEMGVNMLNYLQVRYSENTTVIPRAWLSTTERSNMFCSRLYDLGRYGFRAVYGEKAILAWMLLGLSPDEPEATKLDKWLVAGRWFLPTDVYAVILTEKQASTLGIDPKALPVKVLLGDGVGEFTVVGIISKDYFSIKDLDTQEITPLNLRLPEESGVLPKYDKHEQPDDIFIVTYRFLNRINYYKINGLKSYRASVTLVFKDSAKVDEAANEIFRLFPNYPIYSKTAGGPVTYRWKGMEFKAMGLEAQMIPTVLVVLSILNLMVATVYERRRDVFTFGSLGMSPAHVGSMFFSEAVVYGLMGAVVGYILAILSSRIALAFMPGYITLNYSSSWVANSLSITMFTVIGSSLYPIFLASRMVTPSLKRVWEIPTAPVGNRWEIPMPFYASTDDEANGIFAYFYEYTVPHTTPRAPGFSARDISIREGKTDETPVKSLVMVISLTPYEAGVIQQVTILAAKVGDRWEFRVILERMAGLIHDWEKLNHKFLTELRGQFLMWRTISLVEKARYIKEYRKAPQTQNASLE